MAEPIGSDKTTANIDHSSRVNTNITSKKALNNNANSSLGCGVAWAFACLKISSPENMKRAPRLEQDQLIKEAEEFIKTNSITAVRNDQELCQKVQSIIEGGETRGLLVKGESKVHNKEVTKNAKASIDDIELTTESVNLRAPSCSDEVSKALYLQQKELYESVVRTVDYCKAHPDYEISLEVGRQIEKKLKDLMMRGRRRGLVKVPKLALEEQMMSLNKTAEDERIVQRKARNRHIRTKPDPAFIISPLQHHHELFQLQKTLGGPVSIRDRPAPALVWRQRGYQAAELEYTNQNDPEERGGSWRPKDPLILGPRDSTTSQEKRMIIEGKEALKGTVSGYGGNVFPEVKDWVSAVPKEKKEDGSKSYC